MSHALVRRKSSKVGLEKLMKLTAQRSVEDAEEAERERRRRVREEMRRSDSGSVQGESPESDTPTDDSQLDGRYKPSSSPSLEEDEGFSDWTQRRERQKQLRQQEPQQTQPQHHHHQTQQTQPQPHHQQTQPHHQPQQTQPHHHHHRGNGAEEEEEEERHPDAGSIASSRLQKQEQERQEMERRKQRQEEAVRAERARRERDREEQGRREREQGQEEERMTTREEKRKEESRVPDVEAEKRKEVKVSYTSRVLLNQEPKAVNSNGDASPQEKVSHSISTNSWSRRSTSRGAAEPEESEAIQETEQRLEKIRRGLQEKESQELEQLRLRQAEAEHELEQLKRRREERRRVREEEERRREEEEQSRAAKEEEEKRHMKEEMERRRMEAAERMKSLSCDGDEAFSPFSPKTPTHKITERTESLSRSLKKSNSFKKTPPLVLTSKIDDKLEQYTNAIENSSEARSVKAAPSDLPSAPEVATKKNLFEAGEVFCQSPSKAPGSKDTDSLKVGVANLITQWVKGPDDSGRQGPGKPADVRPGDVMQKRNMWEGMGEGVARPGQRKGSTSGKKYKFVVTGHGKYEKIPVDDEAEGDFSDDL